MSVSRGLPHTVFLHARVNGVLKCHHSAALTFVTGPLEQVRSLPDERQKNLLAPRIFVGQDPVDFVSVVVLTSNLHARLVASLQNFKTDYIAALRVFF